MPWRPLPRIAVAVATYPFTASSPADLPLEIGDDLYIIEQGGKDGSWYRGYLVAPPSLLAGLTSSKGQILQARVFSGIFPKCCVEVREHLGDAGINGQAHGHLTNGNSSIIEQANHNLPRRPSSSTRRSDGRRRESNGSFGKKEAGMNGDINTDVGISPWPAPPPSQHKFEHISDQGLIRTLSHRSIRNSQSRISAFPSPLTIDGHHDTNGRRPHAPVPMLKVGDETPTSTSEPLVDEIASCLREWHSKNLHELLLARRYSMLDKISVLVNRLDLARRQLLYGVLTCQELESLREETIWNLVNGNKLLSNEIIVRDPKSRGRLLNGDDSPFDMSRLQSTMSLLDRPAAQQQDVVNLHHLMIELKAFAANGLLFPTLSFELCARSPGDVLKPLTESFIIEVPAADVFEKSASVGKLRTLFTQLTSSDIGDASRPGAEIYLVIRVQANHAVQVVDPNPRRGSRQDERGKPRPTTGNGGVPSMKGGRQSFMWAQKQLDSVRNRSQHGVKPAQESSVAELSPSEDRPRPPTQDGLRPLTQQGTQYIKRNVGVGLINLKNVFGQVAPFDHHVPIWAPSLTVVDTQDIPDGRLDELLHGLMPSKDGTYSKIKNLDHIRLCTQAFVHPDVTELISKTPTLLQNIIITPKADLPSAPTKPRSDIYVTISEAILPAQALLSHPERGTVQLTSNLELKNVQLTLEVRKRSGARIENCIVPSSDSQPLTAWRTSAVGRGEAWNQMIKLNIPVDEMKESHLIMSIADAPGFPFTLSWMPLWTDDALVKDGNHAPLLYIYDKLTSSHDRGRGAYLDYPWSSKGRYGDEKEETLTGPVATLKLETKLCSTYFSQDKTLLGILNWRQQSKAQTIVLIKRFSFVPEVEIAKLIGDVLDALFGILVNNTGEEEHEDFVFEALITTLGVVHDRRFNLERYVDSYAETRFDHPYATPCLIGAYTRLLAEHNNPHKSRRVRAAFKVGRHILMFILCAREKQKVKEAGIGATTQSAFKRDVRAIFSSFEALIENPAPTLIGNKTLVVQHMPTWLPELKTMFSEEEILELACDFVGACAAVQGKLVLYKLVLILKLVDESLFTQNYIRERVVANTVRWISPHWGSNEEMSLQWREQVRLCCSIVCKQSGQSGFHAPDYVHKVIQSYSCLKTSNQTDQGSVSLLFPTTYPFPSKSVKSNATFDEALIELGALLARLADMPCIPLNDMSVTETASTVSVTLEVVNSIISARAFPKSWLSLYVYHHKSMLQILELVFDIMTAKLVPPPEDADDFNTDLWDKYLKTLLLLIRSDTLALETFPEQKRRAVWKIAGDVREQGAMLLKRSWEAIGWETSLEEHKRYGLIRLGGFQVQYVPGLVAPIVELCLSVHEGLRGVAIRILQAMIVSEWTLNEDLSVVQTEMIDGLDVLFKMKEIGDSLVQKMFINELLDAFESLARMPLEPLWQATRDLVATIDELLELLVAVHGHDMDESLRVMETLHLMNFFKDMQKEDIFVRYVHQLAGVQDKLHNKTEAGLALQLHADQYTWDPLTVASLDDPPFPKQSSFERKEQLYFGMIRYFEEGAAWDCALSSYRELANQYELIHYDFAKLARTQRAMATIYETIAKGEWYPPRYFRVIYYGLGFPPNLRDRQYIYEGEPSERQSAFTDRMRLLHPTARILSNGEPEDLEGQYLQILPVGVYRDLEHPIYQQAKVAQSTREYIAMSRPHRFAVTSKRHSPATGVQDQWIEKTIYSTKEAFPTILRRSEIVSIDTVRLSPLQTAVERTTRKTTELATFEKRVVKGDESGFSNLTEAIISSVDPSSAATVAQYRQLLPARTEQAEEDDDAEQPALSPLHVALQIALFEHVSMLKHCLSHYSRSAHIGTQTSLSESLQHTYAPELALLYPDPSPVWQPELDYLLSSPPSSEISSTNIQPVLTNGSSTQTPEVLSPKRQTSGAKPRLGVNVLKPSFQDQGKPNSSISASSNQGRPNGSMSAPSDGSSSRSHSHSKPQAVNTPLHPITANAKTNVKGSDTGTPEHRPSTSHSSKSGSTGKVRKRLSLLGIGRVGSKMDRPKVEGMGALGEE
ncbi:MAG: hypothetical protein Q9217_004280 [Psora testacea]